MLGGAVDLMGWAVRGLGSSLGLIQGEATNPASNRVTDPPVFGSSLAEIMAAQATKYPDLKVPRILPVLLRSIRDLKGTEREGIFRVSVMTEEREAMRKQVEAGDYEIKTDNPDVSAGLLKEWLRELKGSVIPGFFYDQCIAAAKASGDLDRKVIEIYNELPPVSKNVLVELASICKDISRNEELTRMPLSNLAVVFAPTLLVNPSSDYGAMFINNQYEKAFVASLLGLLGDSSRPAWTADA